MALLEDDASQIDIDYGIYDADEHYYEAEDALTRHLDRSHRGLVRWADIEGRRTLVVNGRLVTVVPNPTYDPVGVPGSLERYFRAENIDGIPIRDIIEMHSIQPEYRDRDKRVAAVVQPRGEPARLLGKRVPGVDELMLREPRGGQPVFRPPT